MAAVVQKRKRDDNDMPDSRPAPGLAHNADHAYDEDYDFETTDVDLDAAFGNANEGELAVAERAAEEIPQQQEQEAKPVETAAAAIAYTMTVPQSTEQSFMVGQGGEDSAQQETPSAEGGSAIAPRTGSFGDFQAEPTQASPNGGDASPSKDPSSMTPSRGSKPPVGTEEWHKIRKDNHKEVERRRRETINEGINELAKIVPGCEKNKGSILGRAVQFITQLKENETQNIEKWTLEKLLTEQAIAELSGSVDKLKAECQRAWAECEQWKRVAGGKKGEGEGGKVVGEDAEGEEGK